MQHTEPPAVERSLALYLALLRAYPPAFRERYGREMALAFRDAARDAWSHAGFFGLIALWARTLSDTVVNATKERVYGSNESVGVSRWQAFASKVRRAFVPTLRVVAQLASVGYGVFLMKQRWLPSVLPSHRGWDVIVGAIGLGLLTGFLVSRFYRVAYWNGCIRWVGMVGWVLWFATSTELGLVGFWAAILPMVPFLSAWSNDDRGETETEWTSKIGRKEPLLIAGPALFLLLTSPAPHLATNVFLAFVAGINGIAALMPQIVLRARKWNVG